MSGIDPGVRRNLIVLARRKSARSYHYPRNWEPETVRRLDGFEGYFTSASAWEYIANLLEGGHEVEAMVLDIPEGATGYVMKVDVLGPPSRQLYIKVHFEGASIIGRSFHYSRYSEGGHERN